MWVDALVILAAPQGNSFDRRILDAAMHRRGWEKSGAEGYTASFTDPQSDESIVNQIEHDVRQAVYVAGLGEFDAVCLLSDALGDEEFDLNLDTQDSDLNLGRL